MAKDIDEIFKKYSRKIESEIELDEAETRGFSREFQIFKREMFPKLSRYEKSCNSLGNIFKIKLAKKDEERIKKQLDTAHLEASPSQTLALAVVMFFLVFFLGIVLVLIVFLLKDFFSLFIILFTLIFSVFIFYYFYSMPARLSNKWRLQASSQMVPCILYVVAYMKHTSNLERAIVFASKHLQPPLSLDFKKVFWDVETGKFSTLKESLEVYLERWRETNIEFVESFHLIESSLYEPSENGRIQILERALQVILDGVYEKTLKYAREVRSPLTNVYMLGIVLPTLGLALIPLASTLLRGAIRWYHLILFFDFLIPFFVFYLVNEALMKRPGGYGETEIIELSPDYETYASKKPYLKAGLIAVPLVVIGLLPFIFQFTPFPELLGLQKDYSFSELGISSLGNAKLFDFNTDGKVTGPFGILAVILSLFIPLGIGMFFSIAYKLKTKKIILAREESRKLEDEFTNSLFQLGNRLGDGVPAEIAFSYVAESTRGQATEGFFRAVNTNLHQLGMSLEQAIFNQRRGAIIYYPSALIAMSMKILVESVKKGLGIAARGLMSISEYVKNIHKINERMRDLLAEVVSDMKSNMTFLAPLLSGIVVGLGNMITNILSQLEVMKELQAAGAEGISIPLGEVWQIFDMNSMIPPYFLQLAIGIYIIEIIFILSAALVTVDAGEDRLRQTFETGKNLRRGVLLYVLITLLSIVFLSLLAMIAIGGIGFG